jgi:hypothetical protein
LAQLLLASRWSGGGDRGLLGYVGADYRSLGPGMDLTRRMTTAVMASPR